jgi:2-keto-4-pentenoate hydratase
MTPHQLLVHHDNGQPWPTQATGADAAALPWPDLASAYATALEVRGLRLARGEVARGFKIGFTNRTIWPRYQVFAPIWGTVWNTTLSFSWEGSTLSVARLCQPRIEPELVFCLKRTPPVGADLQALYDCVDWMAAGFELVQSHQPDWKFSAAQTVADSGLHGRLLVGPPVTVSTLAPDAAALDRLLAGARLRLSRGGTLVEEGLGAHVLDSPLRALLHFVKELRACPGAPDLSPGGVVTTGTWTDAWPVRAGERWSAQFDIPLRALELRLR